ncbi:MAG: glycosyltransferase [Acidobacteria bacterium]|nr:glycosyltransferase [Acidobacteriota bacterium]
MSRPRPVRVLELRSVRGTGGGPEKTILFGAARADASRVHVVVCYIRDRRDDVFSLGDRARALGIEYAEVLERHSVDPGVLPQLVRLVREHKIDLVHAHEYKTDLLALLLARRTGIVPLATAHGWTGQSARERYVYYPVDKWLLSRYPRVVAVSTDIRNDLVHHGARPERITVILNAIDPDAFRRETARRSPVRSALGLADADVVIGAVGRAEPQKRFDLLLEAMVPVFARHPAVRLVIAGDGSQLAGLKAQAATLGISDRCVFTGHRQDVADLHQAFDLFVQSSEYEGTPNAVLEAMAMETPLVATDVGGTGELAADGKHGWLVRAHDVPALTRAVEEALQDPAAARTRARAARQRVETELSFAIRTRRLEDIYVELVHA